MRGPILQEKKIARCLRLLAAFVVLVLLLSLIPLYAAAGYTYPGPDDYRYGLTTHRVWEKTRSVASVLAEAGRVSAQTYRTWQGSYAAIYLMALQPGIFSQNSYWVGPCVLLTALALCMFCFVYTAVRALLNGMTGEREGERRSIAALPAALIAVCCVQFQPYPVEGYYWYNGGVYYTFFFCLSLLAAALLIRRRSKRTFVQWVLLPALMFLLAGGNLITGFLCCGLLLLYFVYTLIRKERDLLLPVCLLLLCGLFAVNALAPGNGVRQLEHLDDVRTPLSAVLAALMDAAASVVRWSGTPSAFLALCCVPLFWVMAGGSGLRFRFPLLLAAFSFLLLAAGYTPTEYALSSPGEYRVQDIQYYLFVLLLNLNLFWLIGWVRLKMKPLSAQLGRRLAVGICAVGVALACASAVIGRSGACVSAVRILVNGAARSYADVWEMRIRMLEDDSMEQVILPRLTNQPPLLCPLDVTCRETDAYYWYNQQIEDYYGKSLVLREKGPED